MREPRRKRFDQPAFTDGMLLGSLWSAEHILVRFLGHRGYPEDEHIAAAWKSIDTAIKIVRKRARTKT